MAEALTRMQDMGLSGREQRMIASVQRVLPFTLSQARIAADLRPSTSRFGLSLGDRACLALAFELNADVYTTDRAWAKVDIGLKIHLLR